MSNYEQRAIEQIQGELERIKKSDFPSDDTLTGFIEANYAHGFIDEVQHQKFTRAGAHAVADRRLELRSAKQARQASSLKLLHEGAE